MAKEVIEEAADKIAVIDAQKAVAMTRVCLWRLREERRAIEDAHGNDAVPAYLNRCIYHLSIFEPTPATESGWVIEKGEVHRPKYLSVNNHRWDWSIDHTAALRFSRQEDAERCVTHFLLKETTEPYRITEHEWEPTPATASEPKEWIVTEVFDEDYSIMCGETFLCSVTTRDGAERVVTAHNATLQPRDCGVDTKRLDWLLSWLRELYGVEFPFQNTADIDIAMKSQTGRKET